MSDRPRGRISPLLVLLLASGARAADVPFPRPADATQLACNLSPRRDPDQYAFWWSAVPKDGRYQRWFWKEIVPHAGDDGCRADAQATFWSHAVPDEWAPVGNIGGWPAASGGYYAQTFWLRAVPRGWARVPDIGGWFRRSGGYYAQTFWLRAVPDGWAKRPELTVGHPPHRAPDQGYYRQVLWERAVPDGWAPAADIGGWREPSGGYYAQWFWLRAVPDGWAPRDDLAIGGEANRGYYDFAFYHLATARDFAWRDALSLEGSKGAGYYTYWQRTWFGTHHPHYRRLHELAGSHLEGAAGQGPAPVDRWFAPDAHAVVILTFDTEGSWAEGCAVARALRAAGVTGTFFMLGKTARAVADDPVWRACFAGFDIANHTENHVDGVGLAGHTDAEQVQEMTDADESLRAAFDAVGGGFRTPWCDAIRSFDASVARNLAGRFRSDSSVATVSRFALAHGLGPPLGQRLASLEDFPYPFMLAGASGDVVELPFAYPSDNTARGQLGLQTAGAPADAADLRHAVNVWRSIFDEVYERRGVMVTLMHPQFQARNGSAPEALTALVAAMKARNGVYFTSIHEAASRFLASRPGRPGS